MTDKALEAALEACAHCGGEAISCGIQNPVGTVWRAVMCTDCQTRTYLYATEAEAIAAWNRRAPLSALPGEAEVVGLVDRLRKGPIAYQSPSGPIYSGPDPLHREAADALQAMQARAERAERERDEALALVSYAEDVSKAVDARAEKAERDRDAFEAKWIAADEGEKLNAEFLVAVDARAEAAEACVKELEEALTINITDQELVRLNNMVIGTDEVKISSRMLLTLVGHAMRARTALKGGSDG